MPVLPPMPTGGDPMGSPMPGPMPMPPMGGPPGGDLSSLLMGAGAQSPSMGAFDPMSGAMRQFDQVGQMIADLARMFPGSDQAATEVMQALDRWRQQILITMTPQPSTMPGADMMM